MPSPFAPDQTNFYLGDSEAHWKRLRAEDPMHWYEPGQFWCATTHAQICEISRRPKVFSSAYGTQLFEVRQQLAGQGNGDAGAPSIIRMDPPEHNRHRKIVMGAFTPKVIGGLEGRVRKIARESLDEIEFGKVTDFVSTVAVPLPMYIIAELLGVPESDFDDFKRWSDALIEAGSGGSGPETVVTLGEVFSYITEKASECRAAPRDDVLSRIIRAEIDGESLGDSEVVIFCLTLLVAGNETTRNLISGGMRAFFEHPDQWALLRNDPELIPGAVEEMLRYVTPVRNFVRRVMVDTELGGKTLKQGQYVLLAYGSANRDEAVFGDDAETFDITREDARRHIAFGFGEHLCLGASLARLEVRVLFEELLKRYSDIELAGEIERLPSLLINGTSSMPVIFKT
jgi:cytochrome P450